MQPKTAKIAIVANSTWNIYNFRLNVIKLLIQNNFEVVVIAPVDHYISYLNQFSEVRHVPLRSLSRKSTNPLKDLSLTRELYQIYCRERPDLVIHYTVKPNIYGGFAARQCGIKYLSTITGLGYTFLHDSLIRQLTQWLYRMAFRHSEKVIFENQDDRQLFIEEGIIRPEAGISLKGCGVDIQYFSPNGFVKPPDTLVFTFIGRLLYDKGIDEFVRAAALVKKDFPEAEFWVVGDIDEENPAAISHDQLLAWMQSGVIRYFGPTSDVRYYIKQSDCIVLPSYREAIPRVVQEGMAMRKPIITTDTPGCREAVEEGKNGFLVPIKDAEGLAAAMRRFRQLSPDQKHTMGRYGRQKAEREFDDRLISRQIVDIIEAVIA
ncbi:MAG: glycosyltransferase family 4 protein [Bacteroidota bacterium]